MKIERIVLTGYRRFRLRQIKKLDYHPAKKTQIILGSNGSGKSSLIEELSPLPVNTKDYEIGGGKEIWISHQGRNYYLASLVTEDGNRFHFEQDGENLNQGFNITGYRTLVKEHFNYTKEIHQVLTGKVTFHGMSVNDRRNWFMSLSDTNYDYAIKYFKRLKDRIRGLQGALDRSQERHTQEIEKQLTPEKEIQLKELVSEQKKQLTDLLDHKPPRKTDQNYTRYFQSFDEKIQMHTDRLDAFLKQHEAIGIPKTLESIQGLRNGLSEDLSVSRTKLNAKLEQIAKIQKQLTEIDGIGQHNLKSVLADIEDHQTKIKQATFSLLSDLTDAFHDPSEALQALNGINDHLLDLGERFQALSVRQCNRDDYKQLTLRYQSLNLRHRELTEKLNAEIVKVKEHEVKKAADQVECPQCKTTWVPNYDAKAHAVCSFNVDTYQTELDKLTPIIKSDYDTLQQMELIFSLHDEFSILASRYPSLNAYWSSLAQEKLFELNPEKIASSLNKIRIHLNSSVQITQSQTVLSEREKLRKLIESYSQADKDKLDKLLEEENESVAYIQKDIKRFSAELNSIDSDIVLKNSIYALYHEYSKLVSQRKEAGKEAILENICQAMEETIYHLRLQLSESERRLSQSDLHRSLIQTLHVEITHLKREITLLKLAEEELSPTSGLIARGMTSFINSFVDVVNEEIERVWLYPLEVCPIDLEGEDLLDLDYKFAVMVNGEKTSGDIADTSSGMKEIINLAFVIASMQFLGLTDYPIFLDEFAVKMDAAHRSSAYRVIEQLIASTQFSQLFLISHYENGYSNLNEADVTVLCASNVVIPTHLTVNNVATID